MNAVIQMPLAKLMKLRSHPEYWGKRIAEMSARDLSLSGRWPGTFDELAQDIEINGILVPLEIDKFESGELILADGHHRAVIAMSLGIISVPVNIRTVS